MGRARDLIEQRPPAPELARRIAALDGAQTALGKHHPDAGGYGMQATDILSDCFDRIHELTHDVVSGLDRDALLWRPASEANPIGWLVWHLTRIQDDHLAGITGDSQVWATGGWAPRFGLPANTMDHGFGHTPVQVAAVRADGPTVLTDYHDQVAERTQQYLAAVDAAELDRVVDGSWDPPVTAGVRLVSVVGDCLQHLGQAAYVRGLWERQR